MLNEVSLRVITCPVPGQVLTSMIGLWDALNVLYRMHYNYTGVSWDILRRRQHLQNISFLHQNRLIRPIRYSFTK